MLRSLRPLAIVLVAAPLAAGAEDTAGKPAAHKIVAVTVYQNTALVTREVTAPEGAGTVELVVTPLPPQTVESSLYAEGGDGLRVLNTRFRTRAIKEDAREEVRKLEAQIKQLRQSQARLAADAKVIDENQKLLGKLEGFTAVTLQHLTDKGVLNSEATLSLTKFIMTTRADRAKELVAVQEQIDAAKEQEQFSKRELGEKATGTVRTERDAVVVVDKAAAAGSTIRLNYLVNAVAWRPQYKVRAGTGRDGQVTVEYLAALHQQTGEDWTNVQVALSTAEPMLSAAPPELASLEITAVPVPPGGPARITGGQAGGMLANPAAQTFGGFGGGLSNSIGDYKTFQQKAQAGRAGALQFDNGGNFKDANTTLNEAAATEQFGELVASRDEILRFNRDQATSEGPSVTYRLRSRLTLPSRNDEQVIEVARLDFKGDFYHKAVPVLTPHVYRQAAVTNASEYVLLPGVATMYLGSDFVGRAQLPLVAIGKGFVVGFGVDPQVQVQRQLANKGRTTTGGNQTLTFDYRILVNSYKAEAVKLQVWDRIPKAEAQAVAVNLVNQKPELSTDALYVREEKPKNLLRWDVTVQPGQNGEKPATIDYTYRLELDKQLTIGAVAAGDLRMTEPRALPAPSAPPRP